VQVGVAADGLDRGVDVGLRVVEHRERLGDHVEEVPGPGRPEQDVRAPPVLRGDLAERRLLHVGAQGRAPCSARVAAGPGGRQRAGGERGGAGTGAEHREEVTAGEGAVVHEEQLLGRWWGDRGGTARGPRPLPGTGQPLRAPETMPPTMRRWARKKTTSIGAATITVPAMTGPQES